jgi:hypothetical protein
MDDQGENPQPSRSEPAVAELAPLDELETDEVPDSMVSDFTSLTTPYCWVITEDAVAGYDGAEPSAVGKSGPGEAVAEDVTEALTAGRFFRLVDGMDRELAIGRLYDPSGQNELAPLDGFGRQNLGALNIEFRAGGDWRCRRSAGLPRSPVPATPRPGGCSNARDSISRVRFRAQTRCATR